MAHPHTSHTDLAGGGDRTTAAAAAGDEEVDTDNPLWSLFLDSNCRSATAFFDLHRSPQPYFHNPTHFPTPSPWARPTYRHVSPPRNKSKTFDQWQKSFAWYFILSEICTFRCQKMHIQGIDNDIQFILYYSMSYANLIHIQLGNLTTNNLIKLIYIYKAWN